MYDGLGDRENRRPSPAAPRHPLPGRGHPSTPPGTTWAGRLKPVPATPCSASRTQFSAMLGRAALDDVAGLFGADVEPAGLDAVGGRQAEIDQPDGLLGRAAGRAGDAR